MTVLKNRYFHFTNVKAKAQSDYYSRSPPTLCPSFFFFHVDALPFPQMCGGLREGREQLCFHRQPQMWAAGAPATSAITLSSWDRVMALQEASSTRVVG